MSSQPLTRMICTRTDCLSCYYLHIHSIPVRNILLLALPPLLTLPCHRAGPVNDPCILSHADHGRVVLLEYEVRRVMGGCRRWAGRGISYGASRTTNISAHENRWLSAGLKMQSCQSGRAVARTNHPPPSPPFFLEWLEYHDNQFCPTHEELDFGSG